MPAPILSIEVYQQKNDDIPIKAVTASNIQQPVSAKIAAYPASESAKDLPSQMEMVQTALSSGSKALVLGTIGEGFVDMLSQAKDAGIPVVQSEMSVWCD